MVEFRFYNHVDARYKTQSIEFNNAVNFSIKSNNQIQILLYYSFKSQVDEDQDSRAGI